MDYAVIYYPDSNRRRAMLRSSKLTILFYQNISAYGGIETLILRLARAEIEKGNNIAIATHIDRIIPELKDIPLIEIDDILSFNFEGLRGQSIDVLSFGANPAAIAIQFCWLANKAKINTRLATGVYHPRDFFRENERLHLHILNFFLARAVGAKNIFFMNADCLLSHRKFLRMPLTASKVVPVPMDSRERNWLPSRDPAQVKIVSVGRIVPFKAYNFSIAKVVHALRKKGVTVSWDIFGHGTHEGQLVETIESLAVEDLVTFRGPLAFKEFDLIVSSYDLFVGMGTAAVQAAQAGIPTLLAIDDDPDGCYGYFSEVPFGNVGEKNPSIPRTTILEAISKHVDYADDEILDISVSCSTAASMYEADNYIDTSLVNSEFAPSFRNYIAYLYTKFHRLFAERNSLTTAVSSMRGKRIRRKVP